MRTSVLCKWDFSLGAFWPIICVDFFLFFISVRSSEAVVVAMGAIVVIVLFLTVRPYFHKSIMGSRKY